MHLSENKKKKPIAYTSKDYLNIVENADCLPPLPSRPENPFMKDSPLVKSFR